MMEPTPLLTCRLRKKTQGRLAAYPNSGEVDLVNESGQEVALDYTRHPLEYLNLKVRDAAGRVLSDRYYGDCFGSWGPVQTLRLLPGETYTHNVSLLGNIPDQVAKAGAYTVLAIYRYQGWVAISPVISVELREDLRLWWPAS